MLGYLMMYLAVRVAMTFEVGRCLMVMGMYKFLVEMVLATMVAEIIGYGKVLVMMAGRIEGHMH